MQSAISGGLGIVRSEYKLRKARKHITLAAKEDHPQVLQVFEKEHSPVHEM